MSTRTNSPTKDPGQISISASKIGSKVRISAFKCWNLCVVIPSPFSRLLPTIPPLRLWSLKESKVLTELRSPVAMASYSFNSLSCSLSKLSITSSSWAKWPLSLAYRSSMAARLNTSHANTLTAFMMAACSSLT
eukprot:Blabericola_migrator_1__3737@NODE_211_length_11365_cov_144_425828_g181_i0_p11_GENE_NODE_211_length_11365_cov_144_425828_g181_i0NODE_211_length_11365_cov_144_425828_g181_i0_p11_ORF_typecomplete_len134_score12_95CYLD_phos_site/PF16607_5/0_036_NODE_211_length_11365_cov_144_425828_g181_i028893290